MEVPLYDGKESINKYMRRVEKYRDYMMKDKYNLILEFINEWLDVEFNSLTQFKSINENKLLKDKKHNRDLIRKYCQLFVDKFNTQLSVDEETDSEEINDKYIIYLLMKMLNYIDYGLTKKELKTNILYTIIKN